MKQQANKNKYTTQPFFYKNIFQRIAVALIAIKMRESLSELPQNASLSPAPPLGPSPLTFSKNKHILPLLQNPIQQIITEIVGYFFVYKNIFKMPAIKSGAREAWNVCASIGMI